MDEEPQGHDTEDRVLYCITTWECLGSADYWNFSFLNVQSHLTLDSTEKFKCHVK